MPASKLPPDRFEGKIRELSDGFARLLAIERVRDVSDSCFVRDNRSPKQKEEDR